MHSIRKRLFQKDLDDDGFTIVEVAIAFLLITGILLGAAYGVIATMAASALAKEHSVATGLANQAMAEAVGISFGDLQNGVNANATCGSPAVNCLQNDPNVKQIGGEYVLELNGSPTPTSTSYIPTSNPSSAEPPIVPETSTVTEGITYTVSTYPTVSTTTAGLVTVVVIVTWTTPTGGKGTVTAEDGIAHP